MPKAYTLKAKGGDEYYDIDLDPGFKEDMYISAVETKPDDTPVTTATGPCMFPPLR